MKKCSISVILFFFLAQYPLSAQIVEWAKNFGGNDADVGLSILQTVDGGYIAMGQTKSNNNDFTGSKGLSDFGVLKLSAAGARQWSRTYGGNDFDNGAYISPTADGGYILCGSTQSLNGDFPTSKGSWDFGVVKIDAIGNKQWSNTYGGGGIDNAFCIKQTSDGGYIVCGLSNSNNGDFSQNNGGSYDYGVVKINATGVLQWAKNYGGSGDDQCYSIEATSDGGAIMCGWSNSNNGSFSQNNGGYDYGVIKINSGGIIEWSKNFGGSQDDKGYCIQQTSDGGFIVNGSSLSNNGSFSQNNGDNDYGVIKMNSLGTIEWSKNLGSTGTDIGSFIRQTSDGYILCGNSNSNSGILVSNGQIDYGVIKINTSGGVIWSRSYGGSVVDQGRAIIPTSDGGFIMCGHAASGNGDFTQVNDNGPGDYGIIKLSGADCNSLNINITGTPTAATCATSQNGKIVLSTNVSTIKNYNWTFMSFSGSGTGNTINTLYPGTYNVTVSLNNGCTATVSNVVVGQGTVPFAAVPTAPTCQGGTNGKLTLNATPAVFSYVWSNTSTIGTNTGTVINNLAAGTYGVTATLTNNCIAIANNIIIPDGVNYTITTTPTSPACANGTNGSIILSSAGTMSSFNWSNGAAIGGGTGANITGLQSGNYSITVTHSNGCKSITSASLTNPSPTSVTGTPTTPICLGKNDGSIALSSATPIAAFSWANGSTTTSGSGTSINNLLSGNYTITVTHTNGCKSTTTVTIPTGTTIPLSATPTMPSCLGKNDASISLSASDPIASFIWSNGTGTNSGTGTSINNLAPGNYSITATLSNGCKTSSNVTIAQGTAPSLSASPTPPTCFGKNDGAFSLSSSEPITTFVWSSGSGTNSGTGSSLSNAAPGSYSITATHSNGCTSTTTVQIVAGTVPQLTGTPTPPTCLGKNDGSIGLSSNAGSVSSYNWTNTSTNGIGTTSSIPNLSPGNYAITVTLSNGCTSTTLANVPLGTAPNLTGTPTKPSCLGKDDANIALSSIDAVATFSWISGVSNGSGAGNTINNLKPGSYTITATLNNGCIAFTNVIVQPGTQINVNGTPSTPTCLGRNDGMITLTSAETISTYNWASGVNTGNGNGSAINNLKSGTYNISVTLANGCISTTTVTITNALPQNLVASPSTPSCFGNKDASIVLSASESILTYNWTNFNTSGNGNSNVISGLSANTYDITATLTSGCIALIKNVVISEGINTPLNTSPSIPSCLGGKDGSIALSASSPITSYFWSSISASGSGSSNSINSLPTGVYNISATLSNGCIAIATSVIINDGNPLNLNTTTNAPTCLGRSDGSINLSSIASVSSFLWVSGSKSSTGTQGVAKNLPTGNYNITATLSNGCIAVAQNVNVANGNPITLPTSANPPLCLGKNNGSISLNISPAVTNFTWSSSSTSNSGTTNTNTITGLSSGTYSVTATLNDKCVAIATNIVVPNGIIFNLNATPTHPTCAGNDGQLSLSVNAQTIQSYNWQSGSNTGTNQSNPSLITGLSSGIYNISATLTNGCLSVGTATLNSPASASISLSTKAPTCENGQDGSIILTPQIGTVASYIWSNGILTKSGTLTQIDSLSSGDYSVTVSFTNGCVAVATTKVAIGTIYTPIATSEESSCSGNDGKIALSGNGFTVLSYELNGVGITKNGNGDKIIGLNAGTYAITATLSNGCKGVTTAIVPLTTNFSVTASSVAPSCVGKSNGSIALSSKDLIASYSWSSASLTGTSLTNLQSGTYLITVTSVGGCEMLMTNVIVPPGKAFNVSANPVAPSCEGKSDGKITLTSTSIIATYTWSNGSENGYALNGLKAGTYSISVSSNIGCETILSNIIIPEGTIFSVSATTTPPSCDDKTDGNIVLSSANDIGSYIWSNGTTTGTTINALQSGTYTITVNATSGCNAVLNNVIIEKGAAFNLSVNTKNPKCYDDFGGAILLDVGNATNITHSWAGSVSFGGGKDLAINNLKAGLYQITVTLNGTGCVKTQTVQISQPPQLTLSLNAVNTSCNGNDGSITPLVNGGTPPFSYIWNDSTKTDKRNNLLAGNYALVVSDNNGCSISKAVEIKSISTSLSSIDTIICEGKSLLIGTKSFEKDGVYTEILKNTKGCDSIVTLKLKTYTIALDAGTDLDICPKTNVTLSAKTDCSTCTLLWNNGSTKASIDVQPSQSSSFTVVATNAKGCQFKDEVIVNVKKIGAFASEDDNFKLPNRNEIDLNIKKNDLFSNEKEFRWNILEQPKSGEASINTDYSLHFVPNPQLTQYQEDVLKYQLCNQVCPQFCDTATVFIKYQKEDCTLEVYNGLTPELNGQNDTFSPLEDLGDNGCVVETLSASIRILNPWGDVIFQPDTYRAWYPTKSGEAGGATLPRGTYYYILTATVNDKKQTIKGTILVIDAP